MAIFVLLAQAIRLIPGQQENALILGSSRQMIVFLKSATGLVQRSTIQCAVGLTKASNASPILARIRMGINAARVQMKRSRIGLQENAQK